MLTAIIEIKVAATDIFGVNAERLLHIKAMYDR
jgi:hypothetical protein